MLHDMDAPENYLPSSPGTVGELDTLGNLMIDAAADPEDPAPDSTLPPVGANSLITN
jgi:hypothetical protein